MKKIYILFILSLCDPFAFWPAECDAGEVQVDGS